MAEFTGTGAPKSRVFIQRIVVVCLLDGGATKAEVNLVAAGKAELVRLARDELQRAMEPQLVEVAERLTGRRVHRFLSGISTSADSSVEVFVLEPEPTTE